MSIGELEVKKWEQTFNDSLKVEEELTMKINSSMYDLIYLLVEKFGEISVDDRYYNCYELDEYLVDFTEVHAEYGKIPLKNIICNQEILTKVLNQLI
jgi:hypothetical protein